MNPKQMVGKRVLFHDPEHANHVTGGQGVDIEGLVESTNTDARGNAMVFVRYQRARNGQLLGVNGGWKDPIGLVIID